MTTLERISELESSVAGFVTTDFSKWSRRKMINLLDEGRAAAISNSSQGGTRIHPDWLQEYVIPFSDDYQESDCYSVFRCPSVIKMKKTNDGFIFVGNDDGTVQYSRINTMGELRNLMKHSVMARTITNGVGALYEENMWKIYSELTEGLIQALSVRAIFNSPTKLPFFNLVKDKYPVDQTTMEFIIGYVKEKFLNQDAQTGVTTTKTNKDPQFNIPSRRR